MTATATPWAGIAGKSALITGASRGIGRAIADALATQGAIVIGTATTPGGALEISTRLERVSPGSRGVVLDVTDNGSVDALFSELSETSCLPAILVNNAGITRDNLLMRMKDADWDAVIETNLSSLYRVSKAAVKHMIKARQGRIINIGSVVGLMGNAGQVNYAAAKAGMLGFTKSLARELAPRNITVNAIAPGFIETDMTAALAPEQREALSKQIPLARLGKPEDVAAAVIFLASDAASYMTGETLNINGGLFMA